MLKLGNESEDYITVNGISPKVSIIVPMYNCARFLSDFFQDMQAQTLTDFEMICVIDGATDDTLEIVQKYAAADKRIRCFYKENGGAGTARNYGFRYVNGEYVIWIDADDCYSPDFLQEMVTAADTFMADEVLCLCESIDYQLGIHKQDIGFNKEAFPENVCVNPDDVPKLFLKVGTGPTNKLYRKSFLEENQLSYSNTMVANDVKFILTAISVAKRVVGVHKHLITFQRYVNPESITSNRGKYTQQVPLVYSELYQWLKERNLFEKYRDMFCIYFTNGVNYNSGFGVNHAFIEAVVHTLNEEEPWVSMSPDEIGKLFGSYFDIAKMQKKIRMIETQISENQIDNGFKVVQLEKEKSRLEVVALIKTYSNIRYHRDFDEYKIKQLKEQLENTKQQLNSTKQQLNREKASWNYKIGSMITWLPKKIYYFFKN